MLGVPRQNDALVSPDSSGETVESQEMNDPIPFEVEYPEAGAFMMRVFASGGIFEQPKGRWLVLPDVPPIKGVPRNAKCPCGSGRKTKVCHREWS